MTTLRPAMRPAMQQAMRKATDPRPPTVGGGTPSYTPAANFNDARNGQYLPLLMEDI